MFCPNCGHQLVEAARFCDNCGAMISMEMAASKSTSGAMLLTGAVPSEATISAKLRKPRIWFLWVLGILVALGMVARHLYLKQEEAIMQEVEARIETRKNNRQLALRRLPLRENIVAMKTVLAKGDAATLAEIRDANENAEAAKANAPTNLEVGSLQGQVTAMLRRKTAAEAIIASFSAQSEAYVACKVFIEKRLVAPSTAEFKSFEERDIHSLRDHDFMFLIDITVDAQNAFGAKLRHRLQCQVQCLTEDSCQVTKQYEAPR